MKHWRKGRVNFAYRAKTRDEYVIYDIFQGNKYKIPDDLGGKFVVDIGAHIGSFSVLCATRWAEVIAIEPYSDSYKILLNNTKPYNVRCLNVGIGNGEDGSLYVDIERPDCSSFDPAINSSDKFKIEKVKTVTLSSILGDRKCDILKCDAEGAERQVCKELDEGLHKQVECLITELHYWEDETNHIGSKEYDLLAKYYKPERLSDYEFKWTK